MLTNHNIILIDSDTTNLTLLESGIRNIKPDSRCICFLNADEATDVILHEFRTPPRYIFIDADTARMPGAVFLKRLRQWHMFNLCYIVIFSRVMPAAVAEVYKSTGADFAFQLALKENDIVEQLTPILTLNSPPKLLIQ